MDDGAIINLLFDRSESALAEVSQKYSGLCKSIIRGMISNTSDVEEIENDVLLAIWNSIPPNRPQSLAAYICRLTRNTVIDRIRYDTRQKRGNGDTLMLSSFSDDLSEEALSVSGGCDDQIRIIISDFIRGLDAETRILFIRRYIFLESVTSLSERFELSENRISVKLYRARKKLKKLLESEDITI